MAGTETFLINGGTLDALTLEQLDALRALVIEEIARRTAPPPTRPGPLLAGGTTYDNAPPHDPRRRMKT
jgi:hypothetical protein